MTSILDGFDEARSKPGIYGIIDRDDAKQISNGGLYDKLPWIAGSPREWNLLWLHTLGEGALYMMRSGLNALHQEVDSRFAELYENEEIDDSSMVEVVSVEAHLFRDAYRRALTFDGRAQPFAYYLILDGVDFDVVERWSDYSLEHATRMYAQGFDMNVIEDFLEEGVDSSLTDVISETRRVDISSRI
jgi:hypothetical protein